MRQVQAYESSDGRLFQTQEECKTYELRLKDLEFEHHVHTNCPGEYSEDAGFKVVESQHVVNYIIKHYDYIKNHIEGN